MIKTNPEEIGGKKEKSSIRLAKIESTKRGIGIISE
jgi:hypothetical protein